MCFATPRTSPRSPLNIQTPWLNCKRRARNQRPAFLLVESARRASHLIPRLASVPNANDNKGIERRKMRIAQEIG